MIEVKKRENYSVTLTGRKGLQIISDVTPAQGGDDVGLDPHEILEASLGACTSITLAMYAKRKNWNLLDAEVVVKIEKEGAENIISRQIKLIGDLTEEQRQGLLKIADKCPIHKMLEAKIEIQTSLA
jgi:putative redox protein